MIKALNTKILLAILAALTLIGGLLIRQEKQVAPISAAAQQYKQQQNAQAAEEERYRKEYETAVKQRDKQAAATPDHSKDVQKYIP